MAATIASSGVRWTGAFKAETWSSKGKGIIALGIVKEQRFHSVTASNDIHRYHVIVLEVKNAHRREKDKHGVELNPDLSKNDASPNKISHDQLMQTIGANGKPIPDEFVDTNQLPKLHPKAAGRFEFWGDPNKLKTLNLQIGDEVEVKTEGDSVFLNVCRCTKSAFSNREGGELMNEIAAKSQSYKQDGKLKQDQVQGVDEAEWDD